jgi:uncharacterized protein YhbP (UPF0306 family)
MSTRELVRRFLDAHSTISLACSDEKGPWAAPVYYARVDGRLYFFSSPESRHSLAFTRDPRVAGAVYGVYEGWKDIRGVQLSGRAEPVSGVEEKSRAVAAYLAKFAFAAPLLEGAHGLIRGKVRLYRLVPDRVLYLDNAMGLGEREDVEI